MLQLDLLLENGLVLALELDNFLHKNINVRLLLIAHLFKLGDVERLFATHPFQHRDISSLLCTHFFQSSVGLLSPLQLGLEHGYVGLQTLTDVSLSLDLRLDRPQVLQLNKVWFQALLLVLFGDLP